MKITLPHRYSEDERSEPRQDGDEVCHFDRSEERAEWRNLAVVTTVKERQDFSTPKFVETNFSGRNDTLHQPLTHEWGRGNDAFIALALTTLALPIAYSLIEPHLLQVLHFDVYVPGLPPEAENWRLVQISDLHFSALGGEKILRQAVEWSNELKPDAVLLTGDYVSRRNSYASFTGARLWARPIMDYAEDMAKVLSGLESRLGIFAVSGNHDHAKGRCDAIEDLLSGAGVTNLRNRHTLLGGILPLAGLDDLRGGRPLIRQALEGIDAKAPQIILSHNPRLMLELRNRNALILSGHTHGGQVHLPFTNFRVRPRDVAQTPFLRGWYRQAPAQLYVSSGLGSVHFPMRFRCPPEMVVFTLHG